MICSNCKHIIEEHSKFCHHCGVKIEAPVQEESSYVAKYPLDYREALSLVSQIRAHFFKDLETIVEEEMGPNQYRKYFDEFYVSNFYKDFDLRTKQLAEEAYSIHSGPSQLVSETVDQLLTEHFNAFINHFIVLHCKALHKMELPETMLRYATVKREGLDLRQMILDYLDFDQESDKVYTDLITIPPLKIKNAIQSFLFTQAREKIYFICDQTVFGSCREGFAMTEQALHWKSHFNPAQSVFYEDIKEIKREAEWLSINGLFFNVNTTMNFKMMKLLKKIRELRLGN